MHKTIGAALAAVILHLLYCSPSFSAPSAFDFSAFQRDPRPRRHHHQGNSNRKQAAFANADLIALRQYALDLVNNDRGKHGSNPVDMDDGLSTVAQAYAEYLAQSGFFGHIDPYGRNPQDRARLYSVMKPVSENLAWSSSNYQTPEELIWQSERDMMAEPPNQMNHRSNILNPRNQTVGIGVAIKGDKVVLVQEFSSASK